jgi:hypothetical protein
VSEPLEDLIKRPPPSYRGGGCSITASPFIALTASTSLIRGKRSRGSSDRLTAESTSYRIRRRIQATIPSIFLIARRKQVRNRILESLRGHPDQPNRTKTPLSKERPCGLPKDVRPIGRIIQSLRSRIGHKLAITDFDHD